MLRAIGYAVGEVHVGYTLLPIVDKYLIGIILTPKQYYSSSKKYNLLLLASYRSKI